jgi:hypothetical protein
VEQLRLVDRLREHEGDFVVWDVGLGAAANPLTLLRATSHLPCSLRLLSFDNTLEPLQFALQHTDHLDYLHGYEPPLHELIRSGKTSFRDGASSVSWELCLGDFPTAIKAPAAQAFAKPHAVMFDAFSPGKNPAMWTQPLFSDLFRLLAPGRPCALPTYSRSTMLRVTLLLAGFFVGAGHPTGEKEETTVAANTADLIEEPLDRRWLLRAQRSHSAEPMWEPVYRQAPLRPATWHRLQQHPQFAG